MRILWITEFFPKTDQGEITGGVEARCFFVKKYLEKKGHKIKIIARETTGSVWHTASFTSLFDRIIFTFKALFEGLKADFDLIEGSNSATFPVAFLVGFLKRKPIFFWYPDVFQGTWTKKFGLVGILGDISDWVLFRLPVSKYIAISNSTRDKLIAKGIPQDRIVVVYCGAEMTGIVLSKKYDICVVSRLIDYKRIEDLVKAVSPRLKVVIVGQGPEKEKLEKRSVGKNITFLGHIASHKEVLKIMASSKILCHPSVVEGFGIVIIEAAALGVPYVARDIPVISEITRQGQGGLLFTNDLSEKIKQLLENAKLYKQKSTEAVELARKYTWEKTARETERVYENLLSH